MEHGLAPGWAEMLQASDLAGVIRQSFFLYPLANTGHVLGIALIVGAVVALDLRLLGFGRGIEPASTSRFLTRIVAFGLLVAVPSGTMMFLADASALAGNWVFQMKIVLAGSALVNAILFRAIWGRRLAAWDAAPPSIGRVQILVSLLLWLGAASSGRLIAYF